MMRKQIFIFALCILMLLMTMPFSAYAQDKMHSFEYIENYGDAGGDGYISVEFDGKKYNLEESDYIEDIPAGSDVKITIEAALGSVITSVVYNGVPKTFGDTGTNLSMTIDNYSDDNFLKVTYDVIYYTCNITAKGNGSAFFVTKEGKADSLSVPVGGSIEFEAIASAGFQIDSIIINGEAIDLEAYGKNENSLMERFINGITDISVDTDIEVVFSEIGGTNEEHILGDANLDNKVNVQDATLIQKFVAGLVSEDSVNVSSADVDGDGKLTVKDATAIQKFTAGIITEFPANK